MTTPEEAARHNTGILRARAAYNADQHVANGRCANCGRAHSRTARLCWKCQQETKR